MSIFFIFLSQVSAGLFDITQGYNVMTFGDFSDENDQIHGKLAAGGNVSIMNSFGVNVDHQGQNITAIVSGGDVTLKNNGQVNGSIYATGTVDLDKAWISHDVTASNVIETEYNVRGTINYTNNFTAPEWANTVKIDALPESPVDFAATQAAAQAFSTQLAGFGSNDFSISSGVMSLNDVSASGDLNFFTIDASDFSQVTDLHFENIDEQYVINIDGNGGDIVLNKINEKNYGTSDDFNFSNVLFNFVNTSTLKIESFYGNLLAAGTDVTADDGMMKGCFIANSFSGKYQFHEITPGNFNPPQNVPESSTVSMIAIGVLVLLYSSRKKIVLLKK